MALYREVLKQSWQVTWRYKMLWIFGFLASFWGIGSAYEIIYKSLRLQEEKDLLIVSLWQDFASRNVSLGDIWNAVVNSPLVVLSIILAVVFSLLVLFLFYWLFTCSQVALIKGIDEAEEGESDFHNLFNKSKPYFWPTFWLNLGGKIVTYLLLFLLSFALLEPLLRNENFSLLNFTFYLLIFIIIFALVLVVAILVIYGTIYIALKGMKLGQALKRSWQLLSNNWLVSLETAFLLFLISLAAGLVFIVAATISFMPFILLFKVAIYFSSILGFWLVVFSSFLFVVIVFILAAALLTTFQLSLWVTIFEKLEKGKAVSKIQRLAGSALKLQ